jgi:hypothetical protein
MMRWGMPPPCVKLRDGHHEMSDLGAEGEEGHSNGGSVGSVWPHSDGWVRSLRSEWRSYD